MLLHVRRAIPALGLVMLMLLLVPSGSSADEPFEPGELVIVRYSLGGMAQSLAGDDIPIGQGASRQVQVPAGMDTDDFLEQLRADPLVESAQRDPRVYAAATPNDPIYSSSSGRQDAYLETIGAPEAWDLATGNDEVVVAILDSGADLTHPDLVAQLWTNPGEIPGNGIDDNGSGCIDDVHGCRFITPNGNTPASCNYTGAMDGTGAVADDSGGTNHSHGTVVSGIVGATGNNSVGITGVAWNVRLMIVKVLDCGGPGSRPGGSMFDVAEGIDYAVRMGARVINLSLASSPGDQASDIPELRQAIERARAQNVIIVASAGNRGDSANPAPGYPAAYTQYQNVVGVGASDWQAGNTWAPFSSYGAGVDLAAPGTRITSTIRQGILQQDYGSIDGGTSFSAPIVTGMFALLAARNPVLPFDAYIDAALSTAQPAPAASHGGNWAGAGIIDIGEAMKRIPMRLAGGVQHNWLDLPAGAEVEARISGKVCGSAISTTFGGSQLSVYDMIVDPDAVSVGCGAPGRTLTVYIDGAPATPQVIWGGQDEPLNLTQNNFSTVTPDPGPIVLQQLSAGWNNVGHLTDSGTLPSSFDYLPGSWTAAYAWDPLKGASGAYSRVINDPLAPEVASDWGNVQRYQAYWVDAQTTTNAATVNPEPPIGRIAHFEPGWNNFVYTGSSKSMAEALANVAGDYTTVLRHDNATGEWQVYVPGRPRTLNSLGGLLHLNVYWIYVEEAGAIVME